MGLVDRLSDVITDIHRAGLDSAAWTDVAVSMEGVLGCDKGAVCFVDKKEPKRTFTEGVRIDPHYRAELQARADTEDFWWLGIKDSAAGTIAVGSDLFDPHEMHRNEYYNELVAPQNIEYCIVATIASNESECACVSYLRGKNKNNFSNWDVRALRTLLPHFQGAYKLHRRLSTFGDSFAVFEALINKSQDGIVFIDERSRILNHNTPAERMLSLDDGLSRRIGCLRLATKELDQELNRLMRLSADASRRRSTFPGGYVRAARPSGELPYLVTVQPLPPDPEQHGLPPAAVAIISIEDPSSIQDPATDAWRTLYGLSSAEARVCRSVFEGASVAEIAKRLCISELTVKSHLKKVFQKCRVHSRSQLMLRLSKGKHLSQHKLPEAR